MVHIALAAKYGACGGGFGCGGGGRDGYRLFITLSNPPAYQEN